MLLKEGKEENLDSQVAHSGSEGWGRRSQIALGSGCGETGQVQNTVHTAKHMEVHDVASKVHPRFKTLLGSPTNSRRNCAIRPAIATASFPISVVLSCLTTAPSPSFHLPFSFSVCAGTFCVPMSRSRSLSVALVRPVSAVYTYAYLPFRRRRAGEYVKRIGIFHEGRSLVGSWSWQVTHHSEPWRRNAGSHTSCRCICHLRLQTDREFSQDRCCCCSLETCSHLEPY